MIHAILLGLMWLYPRVSKVVFWCSIAANFLPRASIFRRWPKIYAAYEFFVAYVAFWAGNIRAELPSLEQEFFGFRRRVRHYLRNRRQNRIDREALNATNIPNKADS